MTVRRLTAAIAGLSRIAVWAGTARDRLDTLAESLRQDARYLEALAQRLDGEDARHLAGVAARLADRANEVATWADAIVHRVHALTDMLWTTIGPD